MRIESDKKLFVGLRVDSKMRDQLEKCPQRDRVFFEAEDTRYLTVMRGGDDSYIGKLVDGATPAASMDDLQRNILSIMNRICPGRRNEDDIKIFSVGDGEAPPAPRKNEDTQGDRGRGNYY